MKFAEFETLCHVRKLNEIREKLGLDKVTCVSTFALTEVEWRIDDLINNTGVKYDRVA